MRAALTITFALLWACKSDPASHVKHELAEPIRGSNPWQWVKVSDSAYQTFLKQDLKEEKIELPAAAFTSKKHWARARTQAIIDSFDRLIRAESKLDISMVPKPEVQFLLIPEPNAYVSSIAFCPGYPAIWSEGKPVPYFEWNRFSESFQFDRPKSFQCLREKLTDAQIQELLDWSFEEGPCRAQREAGAVRFEPACSVFFTAEAHESQDFVVHRLPNQLVVYAGLFLDGTEEDYIYFLVHELGHYYRAHSVNASRNMNTYYSLNAKRKGARPRADPKLKGFAEEIEGLRKEIEAQAPKPQTAAQKKKWIALNGRAFQEGIGQYTTEQEADEVALEYFTLAGFDPQLAVAAMIRILGDEGVSRRKKLPGSEWSHKECQAAFAAGWKGEGGAPVLVPIGDYEDPHHSFCFRAFNLAREIDYHGYAPASRMKLEKMGEAAWEKAKIKLQDELSKL